MQNFIYYDNAIKTRDKELISKPIVIYVNKINEELVEKFDKQISEAHQTGQPIIPIVIDSFGGCAYALLALISIIKNSRIPVATIVEGKAMSSGAVLFSCGTEGHRYVSDTASIMIHDISSNMHGKVGEIEADANETQKLNNMIYTTLAKNCRKEDDYFLKIIHDNGHADLYLTPEQAVEHNIANHIKVPSLTTNLKVIYKFE